MRTLVPAETLVYLETNDLADALQPIVDSKPFMEVAKTKPDFSALKGVQLAVAITGFETSEEKLTDEHSVGRVQPHFVAVADTHAWNYQAVAFAEQKLGSFVANIYDSEPTVEMSEKNGGKYFKWIAADGRKAYALVIDSLIYFGNDETAIDKCLAVKRNETDSIAKTGKVKPADPATLASGYVSSDGIAQIANIIGLKFATEAGEDSEVQAAIAGILPQLLRKTVTDISWTSTKTDHGVEDKYQVGIPPEIANVLTETLIASGDQDVSMLDRWPSSLPSSTIYDLKNPQIAWRSLILLAQKMTDPVGAKMISTASNLFFEPYGIADGEKFLSAVGPTILTAKTDDDSESVAVAATIIDKDVTLKSLNDVLKHKDLPHGNGILNIWQSDDGELSAFVDEDFIELGQTETFLKCCVTEHGWPPPSSRFALMKSVTGAPIKSFAMDFSTATQVTRMFSEKKSEKTRFISTIFTETRFTKTGMERKTTSDFGLIGSIIAQLAGE